MLIIQIADCTILLLGWQELKSTDQGLLEPFLHTKLCVFNVNNVFYS